MNLFENIVQGMRLAFLRPVRREYFYTGKWQAALLILVEVSLWILVEYLIAGRGALFNTYGIPHFVFGWTVFFVIAYMICQILNEADFGKFVVILLASLLPVSILSLFYFAMMKTGFVNQYFKPEGIRFWVVYVPFAIYSLIVLWNIIVYYRVLKLAFFTGAVCSLVISVLVVSGSYYLSYTFTIQSSLFWNNTENETSQGTQRRTNIEDVYYAQQRLLEQSSNRLEAETTGQVDVYVVTFASYSGQEVFKKEVEFVEQQVATKFRTGGKTVRLLNHPSTLEEVALANTPNLKNILLSIGKKMNVDEDVLLLYLTSHGSRDAELSAQLWRLNPNPLNAKKLRSALDESGIKWRIVIISACFSGSFIESLQNEHTLVITASNADNTSFGCSNDRELTYFAEALFDHAWPLSDSITEIFDIAKKWVTKKEQAEGLIPSEPQIFIGEAMTTYLSKIESAP